MSEDDSFNMIQRSNGVDLSTAASVDLRRNDISLEAISAHPPSDVSKSHGARSMTAFALACHQIVVTSRVTPFRATPGATFHFKRQCS
jgi:hypothetical protein